MTTRRSMMLMTSAVAMAGLPLSACAGSGRWQDLFNSKDLTGWRRFGGEPVGAGWVVEDGALALKQAGGGDIVTQDEYGDFELTFDWKISRNGNSGVMYFVRELPETNAPYLTGPEYQVLDNAGHPDGKIPSHTAGAIYDLVTPSSDVTKPVGEWNQGRIVVSQGRIEHGLNGVIVAESSYGDAAWDTLVGKSKFSAMPHYAKVPTGRICLQDHGDPVCYRNIRIRRL